MREWFQVKAQAEDKTVADIHIIDFIGGWIDQMWNELFDETVTVTAKAFVQALEALPASVMHARVHINSPGGDVFGAVNIANALRAWAVGGRTVETIVEGMAASAASLIAMAGSPARISDNGLLMIHQPWTASSGNAREMRKAADELDTFTAANIVPTYQWHTALSAEELGVLLDAETWMNADEAVEQGFMDEKIQGLRAAASIDPRGVAKLKVPEKYAERVAALVAPEAKADATLTLAVKVDATSVDEAVQKIEAARAPGISDAAEVVRVCGEAGLDLAFAQAVIAEKLDDDAVTARAFGEQERRKTAATRAAEVRAICARFKQDYLAAGYIAGSMTVDQVKDHLVKIAAQLDKVEIDSGLAPDHGVKPKAVINVTDIYRVRNGLRLLPVGKE